MGVNGEKVSYEPRSIAKYVIEKGPITLWDIRDYFEYDDRTASWVLMDLLRNEIIAPVSGDYVYRERDNKPYACRAWHLTEKGRNIEGLPEKIETILFDLPVFSEVFLQITNHTLGVARAEDIDIINTKELPPELEEVIKRTFVETIGELTPEQIRQFGEEVKKLKGNY